MVFGQITCNTAEDGEYQVIDGKEKLLGYLLHTPDGVTAVSCEIDGLVETSLNLGILKTDADSIYMQHALRSNKSSSLDFLELKMTDFADAFGFKSEVSARYEPWEYKEDSDLRNLYIDVFTEKTGSAPKVEAIHAGLECAVFSASIPGLDCIAIGPLMSDVHTVSEQLSIASVGKIYHILCSMLEKM